MYFSIDLLPKMLSLLHVCSFKERGACYALMMLPEEQKRKGVISASLGNHALALSYHGHKLNIPVTVVMPIVAPIMKIQSCQQHGARVVVQGNDMGEAKRIAMQLSKEQDLVYING
jgi:threonine dehydratase